jgi:hypothetical protein
LLVKGATGTLPNGRAVHVEGLMGYIQALVYQLLTLVRNLLGILHAVMTIAWGSRS